MPESFKGKKKCRNLNENVIMTDIIPYSHLRVFVGCWFCLGMCVSKFSSLTLKCLFLRPNQENTEGMGSSPPPFSIGARLSFLGINAFSPHRGFQNVLQLFKYVSDFERKDNLRCARSNTEDLHGPQPPRGVTLRPAPGSARGLREPQRAGGHPPVPAS